MNMNREAADTALGYAGNMPMTEDDRKYKNLVCVFCKNLYLPALFNSLCGIDWRCARKETPLHETSRHHRRPEGKYFCEAPSGCIKPIMADGSETGFKSGRSFIITGRPASVLYYVFHNRSVNRQAVTAPRDQLERDNGIYIGRSAHPADTGDPRLALIRPRLSPNRNPAAGPLIDDYGIPVNGDDFPEWDYTPYDADFWSYFSYRLAAALVPKLRAGDGAAGRAQALEAIAAQKGEAVIQRSRSAAANRAKKHLTWAEQCGLQVPGGGGSDSGYTSYLRR